jgi:hypothetical protein
MTTLLQLFSGERSSELRITHGKRVTLQVSRWFAGRDNFLR